MEGILIIVIGIALLYVAYKFRLNIQKIAKNGIETEAVVFDIVSRNNIFTQTSYPVIRFVTTKKEWITEEYSIGTTPSFLKKGQKITVVYSPDNPKEFIVKSRITSAAPILFIILAIIILAIGVYKLIHA
jgi:hypothetical protein